MTTEGNKVVAEIPRSILDEAFTIAILCQQRRDYCCDEAGKEFPSATLMQFIECRDMISVADEIELIDPKPEPLTDDSSVNSA